MLCGMLMTFLLTLSLAPVEGAENLVPNGGFEEGLKGWWVGISKGPRELIRGEVVRDAREGRFAARVTMLTDDWIGEISSSWFPVKGGERYVLTFWYRTENLSLPIAANVRIVVKREDGSMDVPNFGWFRVRASPTWRKARFEFVFPPDAARSYLTFFFSFRRGTCYLDDVRFYAVPFSEEERALSFERQGVRFYPSVEMRRPRPKLAFVPSPEHRKAGLIPFVRPSLRELAPDAVPKPEEVGRPVEILVPPGEIGSGWLSLHALRPFPEISLSVKTPRDAKGNPLALEKLEPFRIHCWRQRVGGWKSRFFRIVPELLVEPEAKNVREGETVSFFIRLKVKETAKPGAYAGAVEVLEAGKTVLSVPLKVQVLPFRLYRRPDRHWMLYLFWSVPLRRLSDEALEPIFRDVKEHGIDSIWISAHHLGVLGPFKLLWRGDEVIGVDWPKLAVVQRLRRKFGFRGPLVIGGSPALDYDHIAPRFGYKGLWPKPIPTDDERLTKAMLQALHALDALVRRTGGEGYGDWVYEGLDEPGGHPQRRNTHLWEMKLAKRAGLRTYVTMNRSGYAERVAPYVDIMCLVPLWAVGSEESNRSAREFCRKHGNEFWYYGVGSYLGQEGGLFPNRYLAGFLFFKSGAKGCAVWIYQNAKDDPWDDFDGNKFGEAKDAMLTYPGPEGPVDTLQWEGIREGIMDCRYLDTIERLLRTLPSSPQKERIRRRFERLVNSLPWLCDPEYEGLDNAACERWRKEAVKLLLELTRISQSRARKG